MFNTKSKISIAILIVLLLASLLFIAFQSKQLESARTQMLGMNLSLEQAETERKQLRILSAMFEGVSRGIHGVEPDTNKAVKEVATYILLNTEPAETKFAECWDRKLRTTDWGSMGPYGLLDECIDTVVSAKSAILLKQTDRLAEMTADKCRQGGANKFEMAQSCWADGNHRLLMSAGDVLMEALTEPNWLQSSKNLFN